MATPIPQATSRVQVLLPTAVAKPFTYRAETPLPPGTLVEVSFAGRTLIGAVWHGAADASVPEAKLKPIARVLDFPPLSAELMKFIDAVAAFTLAPLGAVLQLCGLMHAAKPVKKPLAPIVYTPTLPTLSAEQQTAAEALFSSPLRGEAGWGPGHGKTLPLIPTTTHAKALRRTMTDAERKLWHVLRRENLGIKFRKQHPVGDYIADFACLDTKLIIELDGGQHNESNTIHYDQKRSKFLALQGFHVLRFWNNDVLENIEGVLEKIVATIHAQQRPLPGPPPKGEGNFHKPILLDGVTGSGKTEVYFHAIAQALSDNEPTGESRSGAGHGPKQILVMLPEIALTHQWIARFTETFGAPPTVWHSHLTPAQRRKTWQAVASGDARVVVGARSALFLPFRNLALIVVDEEHEPSYRQEDGVLYHARDMAVLRARGAHAAIILSSATPSLETLINVESGKYARVELPQRFGAATLPTVTLIDLLNDAPERGDFLSPTAKNALLETLARGEQALLFLNRRGYAPLLLCRACGHRFQCEHCSAWMVVHGKKKIVSRQSSVVSKENTNDSPLTTHSYLHCHHCGIRKPVPHTCPSCNAEAEKFAACGPGIERVYEEVRAMFPIVPPPIGGRLGGGHQMAQSVPYNGPSPTLPLQGREPIIALLSSDEAVAPEQWAAIERGEIDIIVGTQMVAKGHHFPKLSLVVVVDADMGLEGADLRAGERCYQLLHQLGGRSGREAIAGRVMIQTYQPHHPICQALVRHDRTSVMQLEHQIRRHGNWPPYGQLAAILLDGTDEARVKNAAQQLAIAAPHDARIQVLGPAPAPLSKLRGQFRYRLLVKADKTIHLQRTLQGWLAGKKFTGVRIKLDVNPYYFL